MLERIKNQVVFSSRTTSGISILQSREGRAGVVRENKNTRSFVRTQKVSSFDSKDSHEFYQNNQQKIKNKYAFVGCFFLRTLYFWHHHSVTPPMSPPKSFSPPNRRGVYPDRNYFLPQASRPHKNDRVVQDPTDYFFPRGKFKKKPILPREFVRSLHDPVERDFEQEKRTPGGTPASLRVLSGQVAANMYKLTPVGRNNLVPTTNNTHHNLQAKLQLIRDMEDYIKRQQLQRRQQQEEEST